MTNSFQRDTLISAWRIMMLILVVAGALWTTSPANALMPIEVRELVIMAPVQQVDTDGDGRLDLFAADVVVYGDGSGEGSVDLSENFTIVVQGGDAACLDEEAVAVLHGTVSGSQDFVLEVRPVADDDPPPGGGGDIILFDIADDASNHVASFTAKGSIAFDNDPCMR